MIPNGTAYESYPSFANTGSKTPPGGSTESAKYSLGMVPADTFPAEWANWLFHGATAGISRLNADVNSIKKELNSILAAYNITNNADAYNQLLTALGRIYPQICTCDTAGATETKSVAITGDGVILKAGNIYSITMTHGNTYGNGSTTYPKLSINSGTAYPLCDARGVYLKAGAWADGDEITVLFTGSKYLMASQGAQDKVENSTQAAVTVNAVSCILAANQTITRAPELGTGGQVRVMFTDNIAGADTTTPLAISYNGTSYTLKVSKDGALQNIYAHEIATNVFRYIQKYTTLELVYDGSNLIVMGNPVVLSGSGYTIYADGYNAKEIYSTSEIKTNKVWIDENGIRHSVYRKVYTRQDGTLQGDYTIDNRGIISTLVSYEIIIKNSSGNWVSPSYFAPDNFYGCGVKHDAQTNNLVFSVLGGNTIINTRITYEYTKTTD